MRDGERRHDQDERAEPPERDHQAQQEQQVIGAVEDVQEPSVHESPRRLVPARIQPHQAGIAGQLERALRAGRRLVAQHGDDADAEARERRMDRKVDRSDWIGYSNRTSSSAWFQ